MAAALRRLNIALVAAELDDDEIDAASARAEQLADHLEQLAAGQRRQRRQPDPRGRAQEFLPTSPVIGLANAVAPPVEIELVEGEIRGRGWFDYPYEGPPTCVHGGIIALVLDEVLGAANIAAGAPGMTGTLTIRYRKPTPLRTELRIVGRHQGRDPGSSRKIRAWGGIYVGDTLTAEAEGIFVELVPEKFLSIVTGNAKTGEPGEPGAR